MIFFILMYYGFYDNLIFELVYLAEMKYIYKYFIILVITMKIIRT